MQNRKRKILSNLNFVLIAILLILTNWIVLRHENPERMVEGQWREVGWYFEKVDETPTFNKQTEIHEEFKQQLLNHLPPLKSGNWHFIRNNNQNYIAYHDSLKYDWYIKGRGHILELRSNNKLVESFIIQDITKDSMILHLNIDLQTKGIAKIVLKRDDIDNKYVKKI